MRMGNFEPINSGFTFRCRSGGRSGVAFVVKVHCHVTKTCSKIPKVSCRVSRPHQALGMGTRFTQSSFRVDKLAITGAQLANSRILSFLFPKCWKVFRYRPLNVERKNNKNQVLPILEEEVERAIKGLNTEKDQGWMVFKTKRQKF